MLVLWLVLDPVLDPEFVLVLVPVPVPVEPPVLLLPPTPPPTETLPLAPTLATPGIPTLPFAPTLTLLLTFQFEPSPQFSLWEAVEVVPVLVPELVP